jgi:ABC-type phosphate/phosphonate transport system substrate-binding protein
MSERNTLILGAVAYDPKVVTIWDGFQAYFGRQGLNFDYILYSNYERQVQAQFAGHIGVAWNSPLAWLQSDRRRCRTPGAGHLHARHRSRSHLSDRGSRR